MPTQILPSFLLAVGVGASVHLLAIFYKRFDDTRDKDGALAYIWIEVERSGQTRMVAAKLAEIRELGFVGVMLGRADILAITMVRNAEHLSEFVHQRISVVEGVRGTHSTLGVNFVKHDYRMARIVS